MNDDFSGHDPVAAADFDTGLVAQAYRHLRSETFDPAPYASFVEGFGQPALELGCGDGDPLLDLLDRGLEVEGLDEEGTPATTHATVFSFSSCSVRRSDQPSL